jgi:hypothetical protein
VRQICKFSYFISVIWLLESRQSSRRYLFPIPQNWVCDADCDADCDVPSNMHCDHWPPGTEWNCWQLQGSSSIDSIGWEELVRHPPTGLPVIQQWEQACITFYRICTNTNEKQISLADNLNSCETGFLFKTGNLLVVWHASNWGE